MAIKEGRQPGRYVCEFCQGGIRIFRRFPPGVTKRQAEEWETKRRRDLFDIGPLGNKPEITLAAAIQLWLENNHRKNQRKAQSEAKQWAEYVSGKLLREAPEVAATAVRKWSSDVMTHGRVNRVTVATAAASTINRRLCVLKAAAKYAWRQGWIQENVSGRITLLPERNQREVYLTKAQVNALAKAVATTECRAAVLLAAHTGLRASELLSLTGTVGATLHITQSKTGKPRVVPVPSSVRHLLRALPLGLSYWQLHKEFDKAKVAAGLPHVRFHDLRHTCASWLINEGVDLYTVGKILGHSGPQTTARYAHLADKTLKKAMARLR